MSLVVIGWFEDGGGRMANKAFFTEEEIEGVLGIITHLYIENNGRMPNDRQVKKCKDVNSSRYALMRRFIPNRVSESVVRELALKFGYDFASPEDKHLEGLKKAVEEHRVISGDDVYMDVVESASTSGRRCGRKPGRSAANPAEVLADFKALALRLKRNPTVADMRNENNGAKYSYETYIRLVGDRTRRVAIWNEMRKQMEM